jgi:hypothetical protein
MTLCRVEPDHGPRGPPCLLSVPSQNHRPAARLAAAICSPGWRSNSAILCSPPRSESKTNYWFKNLFTIQVSDVCSTITGIRNIAETKRTYYFNQCCEFGHFLSGFRSCPVPVQVQELNFCINLQILKKFWPKIAKKNYF